MQKLCCVCTRQQYSASLDHLSPAFQPISPSILNHFWWELYHTGGIEGGAEGVTNVGMVSGGLAWGVEASGAGAMPEGVSGDTSPLGVVNMVVGSN